MADQISNKFETTTTSSQKLSWNNIVEFLQSIYIYHDHVNSGFQKLAQKKRAC